jgi:4-hydroxy-tetrahydrodipicolinate synthase
VLTLMKQGDRNAALACWKAISALTRLLFAEPSPAPAKYWLARVGLIDSAQVRLPMVEVSAELAALLDEEIERRRPQLLRGLGGDRLSPAMARGRNRP